MPWKCLFYFCYCERKNIYGRIRNWIRNFLLVREDPNPILGRKWDADPKKIVSDPQHTGAQTARHNQLITNGMPPCSGPLPALYI
jgi:hypothetical protein